ncbi:MAG: peptidase MA family metallohydrolase [Anaerolineales bacterium]
MVLLVVAASMLMNAQQVARRKFRPENADIAVVVRRTDRIQRDDLNVGSPSRRVIVIFDEGNGITQVQPLTIQSDGATQFIFDARQNVLKPFAYLRWHYEFTLADGSVIQSETYSVRYDDTRFSWQKLESNGLRVFWYAGDSTFAQNAMNAALAGVRAINEIFPIDLNQPIDIFIYSSQNDLAFLGAETWTAGHANAALGVVLVAIEPNLDQSLQMDQRIPHELMHVLLYRHIGAGYNNLPAWLREGLATMVEINPTSEYDRVLLDAHTRGNLIPLLDVCDSFPVQPDSAFLAYAESRSFTAYLRNTFGSSKLLELSRSYADGITCERGVEVVYGTSLAQLELRWRESTFGENAWGAALQNMFPYLLLCGLKGIPLLIVCYDGETMMSLRSNLPKTEDCRAAKEQSGGSQ